MKKSVLAIGLLAISSFSFAEPNGGNPTPSTDIKLAFNYEKLKVQTGVTLVDGNLFAVESIAVSTDGQRLCWIGKESSKKWKYPVDIFMKNADSTASTRPTKIKKHSLNAFSKCAFDNDGNILASELVYRPFAITVTLVNSLITGDFEPKKYKSVLTTYDYERNEKIDTLTATQIGQKSTKEFIKHPRISPDNNWLTYYTMGNFGKKGIYLLNLKTNKSFFLGERSEKHPTWSPDGTKILFHFQKSDRKKGGLEQSYLGYYKVRLDNNKVSATRVMLDDPNKEGYAYHKHPAVYPGTDLVFFHGQTKPEGKKKIFVRKLAKDSQIYEVKMKTDGVKIKKAKHPSTALVSDSGVYFVGKRDVKGEEYKIYRLESKSVQNLRNRVK